MKRTLFCLLPLLVLMPLLAGLYLRPSRGSAEASDAQRPYGIDHRIPWTTSRITGSPEPPPPYRIERVFPKLTFKHPLLLVSAPGADRLFIGEQEGKLYSFHTTPDCAKADLLLDLTRE